MLSGYFFPLEVLRTFGLGSIEKVLYLIPTTTMLYNLRSMLILGPGNYDPLGIIATIVINGIIAVFALIFAFLIMRKTTRKAAYSGTLEFY